MCSSAAILDICLGERMVETKTGGKSYTDRTTSFAFSFSLNLDAYRNAGVALRVQSVAYRMVLI